MSNLFQKWRCLGFDPEKLYDYSEKMIATNLSMMKNISLLMSLLLFFGALYPLLYQHSIVHAMLYLVQSLLSLGFFFLGDHLQQRTETAQKTSRRCVVLFMHTISAFGIYHSVISNPHMISVLFFICILCLQFAFILSPMTNMLSIFVDCVVFCILSFVVKGIDLAILDFLNCVVTFIVSSAIGWQIARLRVNQLQAETELSLLNHHLYELSTTDSLTGLHNRRRFTEEAARRIVEHAPDETYIATLVCDIDFFKQYNDFYGHDQGDIALQSVAKRLMGFRDNYDILLCRWGGEEFMALFLTHTPEKAHQIASLMCNAVYDLHLDNEPSAVSPYLTMSVGLYIVPSDDIQDWNELYRKADEALYLAKKSGRNRVITIA